MADIFKSKDKLITDFGEYIIYRLTSLEDQGMVDLEKLPFSIRIMLESVLRLRNEKEITVRDVENLAHWKPVDANRPSMPYRPGRVIMQDFTGVPAVVDLAAMRSAMARLGGDPSKINPVVPVDLVIDHSVQVDFFATSDALQRNSELEFQRNKERYEFLNWGEKAFGNFQVVPPATGIVHQVNLEYLAKVVLTEESDDGTLAFPDTLVGTDSHTTMINALGVVGWGVGGIEAEAAILGQPIDMLIPDVVGFKIIGDLAEGVTATDLVLKVTQMLRNKGVVGKFVEFYGPGLDKLSLPDRATIANMAPEYGATMGFFPVDEVTLDYMYLTGRSDELVAMVEKYLKEQKLFRTSDTPDPEYTDTLELDLKDVEPNLAGPKRPQDRISLAEMQEVFHSTLKAPVAERGFNLTDDEINRKVQVGTNGSTAEMGHGSVVIAAITSCTNTSNPTVMVGAGLLAKKAVELGLKSKPYVKTSLAPGSRVVSEYLEASNLLEPLADLGFNIVGYGCTTCIGNSGPLPSDVVRAINEADLVAAAVLSGNRNFEGRISPHVQANYLSSPPLVIAYALAGTVDIDLNNDPIGEDREGNPVYLKDIWPTSKEIQETIQRHISPEIFKKEYANVFTGNETWNAIQGKDSEIYDWDPESTYIQEPPFFTEITPEISELSDIVDARALVVLGDSITTDHISPAGAIPKDSPAGRHLMDNGVKVREFNSYGSRRGNDRVMTRGTFGNIRLKNQLVPGVEGGYTINFLTNEQTTIFEAAEEYKKRGIPLVVFAGTEYGTGSSRDWAAKGTLLLGVNAVIAKSYERIHRSNLVGMGVLPLQFKPGDDMRSLDLDGSEIISIRGLSDDIQPGDEVWVTAKKEGEIVAEFPVIIRLDTQTEVVYYKNGGILHTVLRNMV